MNESDETRTLKAEIRGETNRLLLLLNGQDLSGRELPIDFPSKAEDFIHNGIRTSDATLQELQICKNKISALADSVADGRLTDRVDIIQRMGEIYGRTWHRSVDLSSVLEHIREINLGW